MKSRGRLMMVVATVVAVVSVVAPLLAGYCFDCPDIGQCGIEDNQQCVPRPTGNQHAICDTCRHTTTNKCPVGYYCCTACVWEIYNCRRGPNYSIQCSSPPYISKLVDEENKRRTTGPFRCSPDQRDCLEN